MCNDQAANFTSRDVFDIKQKKLIFKLAGNSFDVTRLGYQPAMLVYASITLFSNYLELLQAEKMTVSSITKQIFVISHYKFFFYFCSRPL